MTQLEKLMSDKRFKLTELRKEVLEILLSEQKSLTAYEILAQLKKVRVNAEPPTVYRTLAYLLEVKLIHRIESNNQYVCCVHIHDLEREHHGVLFFCEQCHSSFEYFEKDVGELIEKFSKKHHVEVSEPLIEMKGVCQQCREKSS